MILQQVILPFLPTFSIMADNNIPTWQSNVAEGLLDTGTDFAESSFTSDDGDTPEATLQGTSYLGVGDEAAHISQDSEVLWDDIQSSISDFYASMINHLQHTLLRLATLYPAEDIVAYRTLIADKELSEKVKAQATELSKIYWNLGSRIWWRSPHVYLRRSAAEQQKLKQICAETAEDKRDFDQRHQASLLVPQTESSSHHSKRYPGPLRSVASGSGSERSPRECIREVKLKMDQRYKRFSEEMQGLKETVEDWGSEAVDTILKQEGRKPEGEERANAARYIFDKLHVLFDELGSKDWDIPRSAKDATFVVQNLWAEASRKRSKLTGIQSLPYQTSSQGSDDSETWLT